MVAMIDSMVKTLQDEQAEDSNKEYCNRQLDGSDDKRKGLERDVADIEASIADADGKICTLAGEIKSLKDEIEDLDKSVADATSQRKSENEAFFYLVSSNTQAKKLIEFAINRL